MRRVGLIWMGWAVSPIVAGAAAPDDPYARVNGMTISCQTWGWEWGTDEMVRAMEELKALGVNWIAIHPYAAIRADGEVVASRRTYDRQDWLVRPIAEAHRLGLKLMIKPHLAYWGSPFSWRGAIRFTEDAHWARFFATYEAWVVRLAERCAGADAFVVGTELDQTIAHQDSWRRIIRRVREHATCPLTYAANWTDYRDVPFWDALDVIGIQAYFPLTDHAGVPTPDELSRSWSAILEELDRYARDQHRQVVFTELGYNCSSEAASKPWAYRSGGDRAAEIQQLCLDAALRAVNQHPTVMGAFLWKWFAGPSPRENFLKSTPEMRAVIRSRWAAGLSPESTDLR